MNLLLLLSALLSALTGVGASARGQGPAATITEQVAAPRVAAVAVQAVRRPVDHWPNRPARVRIASRPAPGPREPLFLLRRRE